MSYSSPEADLSPVSYPNRPTEAPPITGSIINADDMLIEVRHILAAKELSSDAEKNTLSQKADGLADSIGTLSLQTSDPKERLFLLESLVTALESAYELAPADMRQARALKLASAYLTLAIDFDHSKARQGLELTEHLRGLNPNDPVPHFMASQFLSLLKRPDEAAGYFQKAFDLSLGHTCHWPRYAFHDPGLDDENLTRPWPGIHNLYQEGAAPQNNRKPTFTRGQALSKTQLLELLGLKVRQAPKLEIPYNLLSADKGFWATAVVKRMPHQLADFYQSKFKITPDTGIMSLGSCFAPFVSEVLKERQLNILDYEPPFKQPHYFAKPLSSQLGYGLHSARCGNISSARQLRQTFDRAFGHFNPLEEFWQHENRWHDPFRPLINPGGFFSLEEARLSRQRHLKAVRRLFEDADVLMYTMGQTEVWAHRQDGAVYPLCPGASVGNFDPDRYELRIFSHDEITADLRSLIEESRKANPGLKFLFMISPVPQIATAGGEHIMISTMKSKSIMRSALASICDQYEFADYFPLYDVVASIPFGRGAYNEDLVLIKPEVLNFIMNRFLAAHGLSDQPAAVKTAETATVAMTATNPEDEAQCEEILLEAFNK